MAGDRWVWVPVGALLESLSGAGAAVWRAPAEVRRTIGELLGVLPVTHLEIDLGPIVRSHAGGDWRPLLDGSAELRALLGELSLAVSDAVAGRAAWGLRLPRLVDLAAALGDGSERGLVKAGVRLASTLQAFRESPLRFVTLAIEDPASAAGQKQLAPVLRNAGLYGWQRAAALEAVAKAGVADVDIWLVDGADVGVVVPFWTERRRVGGGLTGAVWSGEAGLPGTAPPFCVLYGVPPEGLPAAAIVGVGQKLRAWLGA